MLINNNMDYKEQIVFIIVSSLLGIVTMLYWNCPRL